MVCGTSLELGGGGDDYSTRLWKWVDFYDQTLDCGLLGITGSLDRGKAGASLTELMGLSMTEVKAGLPSPKALLGRRREQSEGDVSIMFLEILSQRSPQSLVLISI